MLAEYILRSLARSPFIGATSPAFVEGVEGACGPDVVEVVDVTVSVTLAVAAVGVEAVATVEAVVVCSVVANFEWSEQAPHTHITSVATITLFVFAFIG